MVMAGALPSARGDARATWRPGSRHFKSLHAPVCGVHDLPAFIRDQDQRSASAHCRRTADAEVPGTSLQKLPVVTEPEQGVLPIGGLVDRDPGVRHRVVEDVAEVFSYPRSFLPVGVENA